MTDGGHHSRDNRRERERKARRLWRHYEPPEPGDAEPEGGQQPWATYRRRPPEPPPVTTTPAPAPAPVPVPARSTTSDQDEIEAGERLIRHTIYKLFGIAAMLGLVAVAGVFDGEERDVQPPDGPAVVEYAGLDPRTGAGLDELSDLLEAQLGDDLVVRAVLRSDGADLEVARPDGRVDVYLWLRSTPSVVVQHDTRARRGGTPVDLDEVAAELLAAPLSRLQQEVGADAGEGEVMVFHAKGSPTWVEITVPGQRRTGVARIALDGTVLSEKVD